MSALERHQQAVDAFNAHDAEAVVDLYTTDAVLHDPQYPEPIHGREAIRKSYEHLFRGFPDIHVAIVHRHVHDDVMVYELRMTGTNRGAIGTPDGDIPATNRRMDVAAAVFADLDSSGRFRRVRRYYDNATMMRQLGLLESGAVKASH